jgi:hypothetical protein
MNEAHKIAVFGKDVYLLYVFKIPEDSRILLCLRRNKKPKYSGI